MANLDFTSVPEDINEEEEEEEEEEDEQDTKEDLGIVNDAVKPPVIKPTVASKPSNQNAAWKLPTLESNILLKKTSSSESKSEGSVHEADSTTKIPEATQDPLPTPATPPPVPQKGKQKRRSKRFKFHLFKFRGSRKENGKKYETGGEEKDSDANGNLAETRCFSVDSGGMPLGGGEVPKGWRNRRRRKSEGERKRLSWLMQLFHLKKADDTKTSADDVGAPLPSNGNHGNTHPSDANGAGKDKTQTNGHVSEVKPEINANVDALNDDHEDDSMETVSDLKKKFERISAGF